MIADLNVSISPSDFTFAAAFLADLGFVSISSQSILPNRMFFPSSSHTLFLWQVWMTHSISRCLADCSLACRSILASQTKPGTFLEWKKSLRPIFSVLIWKRSVLAALPRPLCIFHIFFVGFGWTECNSLTQANSHCSRLFCSSASLIAARDPPSFCSFEV